MKPTKQTRAIVKKEIKKRKALVGAIKAAIDRHFIVLDSKYMKRGRVQKAVADYLGVCQNNLLARQVIEFLKSEGCELVMIHGRQYFKNLCDKKLLIETDDFQDDLERI